MKKLLLSLAIIVISTNLLAQNGATVTISGQVTDFDGNPIENSAVILMGRNFNPAYMTTSDATGHYVMEVEKGQYIALVAIRLEEYPRALELFGVNPVAEEDMRLQFWAWNVIADRDLTINARYHQLELYGFRVFDVIGSGSPYMMAFVRPMSLGHVLKSGNMDVSVNPEDIEFRMYASDKPLPVSSVQVVYEHFGENETPMRAFFLQFERPQEFSDVTIFRVVATYNAFGGEKGENWYFYRLIDYR